MRPASSAAPFRFRPLGTRDQTPLPQTHGRGLADPCRHGHGRTGARARALAAMLKVVCVPAPRQFKSKTKNKTKRLRAPAGPRRPGSSSLFRRGVRGVDAGTPHNWTLPDGRTFPIAVCARQRQCVSTGERVFISRLISFYSILIASAGLCIRPTEPSSDLSRPFFL